MGIQPVLERVRSTHFKKVFEVSEYESFLTSNFFTVFRHNAAMFFKLLILPQFFLNS